MIFRKWAAAHWFILAGASLIAICYAMNRLALLDPVLTGFATIACLAVMLPLLYLACYPQTPRVRKIVRTTLIAFFGLWLAGHLIPPAANILHEQMVWIGYLKWPVFIYLEIQTVAIVWRAVFQKKKSSDEAMDELVAAQGLPAWVATIGKMEVACWKALGRGVSKTLRYLLAVFQTRKS